MNKKTVAIRENISAVLSRLGRVWEVPFGNGKMTKAIILTLEGVRSLGIDFNRVFIGCGGKEGFEERTDVKNGILVNLDLFQELALLKEIVRLRPELREVLGLYNSGGSKKVYEVLHREGVPKELGFRFMWTGEIFTKGIPDTAYDTPKILTVNEIPLLTVGGSFIYRYIDHGDRDRSTAYYHSPDLAVIFGARI